MDWEEVKSEVISWLAETLKLNDELSITDVERNAGSIYITLSNDTTKSLVVIECEKEEV